MNGTRLADYTTEVPISQSLAEIMDMLGDHGASDVGVAYRDRQAYGIQFAVTTHLGQHRFRLVCEAEGVLRALEQVGAQKDRSGKRLIPLSRLDLDYARRVGWRILRDWVRAQTAMITIGLATFDQVMLPYLLTDTGETLYERLESGALATLLDSGTAPLLLPAASGQGR